MHITRWNPFGMEPLTFEKEFDSLLKDFGGYSVPSNMIHAPSINMYQKDGKLFVECSIPGVDADNVTVDIDDSNVLTITGTTKKKTEVDEKNYYRKEIRHGSFSRSIQLPAQLDKDKASADYEDGLLTVAISIGSQSSRKSIKVEKKKKI